MRYRSFTVRNYKGISGPITIVIDKKSIFPIIGVNESGKTTLLESILAFDKFNDSTNDGSHLIDTENYYDPADDKPAIIEAQIELSNQELHSIMSKLLEENEDGEFINEIAYDLQNEIQEYAEIDMKLDEFHIKRYLPSKKYKSSLNLTEELDEHLCSEILKKLPYILYFDDFRDSIEKLIDIPEHKESENQSKWIPYFQELIKFVNPNLDIYSLRNKNSNQRDSIIRSAEKILKSKLTEHWSNFNLLNSKTKTSEPLKIELKYHHTHHIEVRIVEEVKSDKNFEERFFNIKDRSKGFFWYFNFIMKLEFNPNKRSIQDKETIYLLDEPGSFLHSTAQKKLCERLKSLSENNKVIYCTHSPYLLNPDFIPINNILIAAKNENGSINCEIIHNIPLDRKNAAFQPILHALQIIPVSIDYDKNNIVLTEGIYDYYCFNLFGKNKLLNYFPCDGADSIKHHISYMIFLGKKYSAIWDKDTPGLDAFEDAQKSFGEIESMKWSNYSLNNKPKVILQDLIAGIDMKLFKEELGLSKNSSFTKTIASLYHSNSKRSIIKKVSSETKSNFERIEKEIDEKINKSA